MKQYNIMNFNTPNFRIKSYLYYASYFLKLSIIVAENIFYGRIIRIIYFNILRQHQGKMCFWSNNFKTLGS